MQLLLDPVTKLFNGHAVIKMKSAQQASWGMEDLNQMLFAVNAGPRPLQASVAMAGLLNIYGFLPACVPCQAMSHLTLSCCVTSTLSKL